MPRREALRLLKALEERFRGSDAAAFLPMKISALERIIDIESLGLQLGDVVPRLARIQSVQFTGRPGSSDIRFSYRPVGMDGLVRFYENIQQLKEEPSSCFKRMYQL